MDSFESDDEFFVTLREAAEQEILTECKHDFIEEVGSRVCTLCGVEEKILDYSPEWRHFDVTNPNPSRCACLRKQTNILDKQLDSLKYPISAELKKVAEDKYRIVSKGKTMRGTARRGIIAACVMFALRESGQTLTSDDIRQMFDLTKKSLSSGISKYYEAFPADRTKHIRPENLVHGILTKVRIPLAHTDGVLRLMKMLSRCSRIMIHSSPQSVAAAVIFLYLCTQPALKESLGLTKSKYAEYVSLSDITVTKLAKEAKEYLEKTSKCEPIMIADVKVVKPEGKVSVVKKVSSKTTKKVSVSGDSVASLPHT